MSLRRQQGEVVETPAAPSVASTTAAASIGSDTLSTILDAWLRERKPFEKTAHEWTRAVRRWTELRAIAESW